MKTLYIVRGLPGSGKSTFAQSLGCPVFEADMFFVNKQGVYTLILQELKMLTLGVKKWLKTICLTKKIRLRCQTLSHKNGK